MAFDFFHLFIWKERKSSVRIWKRFPRNEIFLAYYFLHYFFQFFPCCRLDILSHCICSTINSDKWKHMNSSILKYKQKTHTTFCWHPVGVDSSFVQSFCFVFICYFSAFFFTQGMCHICTYIVKFQSLLLNQSYLSGGWKINTYAYETTSAIKILMKWNRWKIWSCWERDIRHPKLETVMLEMRPEIFVCIYPTFRYSGSFRNDCC